MTLLLDFCILLGCVLAGVFFLWRSHVNFTKGYVRLGYAYALLWLTAVMIFIFQSYMFGL
jgi:hypothetical protein